MYQISVIVFVNLDRKRDGLVWVGSSADIPSIAGKI